jgi:ADP-ribosyl-[dinitrogen reductase] hydrolase
MMVKMKHPNPEMLLRIAQADTYAIGVEYMKDPELTAKALEFRSFFQNPRYLELTPGRYTDDTQMSIAVAEVIAGHNVNAHTRKSYEHSFYECYKRDPRPGYSKGFQSILDISTSVEHMLSLITPTSDRNGAAMRAVPIGVFREPYVVKEVAALQARITHATPGGIRSAQAVALMSYYAMWTDRPLLELPNFLKEQLGEGVSERWDGTQVVGEGLGLKTARAVCTLVSECTDLMSILRCAIRWGGDTDTVAAIAWGIASARFKEPVPSFLEDDLEPNGKYGPEFLKDLGARLIAAHDG